MAFTTPAVIDITDVTPRPFGLLSVAQVTSQNRIYGSTTYSWPSSDAAKVTGADIEQYCVQVTAQETQGVDWATTSSYTHEAFRECSMLGGNDYAKQATAVLDLTRDYAAQAQLSAIASGDGEQGLVLTTNSGVTDVDLALAVAVQEFASVSALRPVVHLTPKLAVLLDEHLRNAGSHLELKTGELVAVEPQLAVPDEDSIVVTGDVRVAEGASRLYGPVPSIPDNQQLVRVSRDVSMTVLGPVVIQPVTFA